MAAMMAGGKSPDLISRALHSAGQFRGKARLADILGRLAARCNGGAGTFSPAAGQITTVDLSDRIQRLMWGGAYEPHIRQLLAKLLRPGDMFVDIGAHIGFFTLIASSLVGPSGRVYAFEADSELFAALRKNVSPYPWVVASPKAVWSRSGPVMFSKSLQPGETGWGKLAAIRNDGRKVEVEATSLDDWHESAGSPRIRAIKLDAEGSEPFILDGAKRLIAREHPFLIMELNDQLLRDAGRPRHAVINALRNLGYEIFATAHGQPPHTPDGDDSAEILCVPRSIASESKGILKDLDVMACR